MFDPDDDSDDLAYEGPIDDEDDRDIVDDLDDPDMEDLLDSDEDFLIDEVGFADPGGRSALRAATASNPRDQPCPTCGRENVLTRIDVARRYQCDRCADIAEGRMGGDY